MSEHLVRIKTKTGAMVDFRKEGTDIKICNEDHCVILPNLSGNQTASLFGLLEPFGETEVPEDEDEPTGD